MSVEFQNMTMKEVYVQTLLELGETHPDVIVVEADMALTTGSAAFGDKYPDRFFDVGVAEANMIGISAGLAADGKVPFCASFTPFVTRRAYDQITISVAFSNRNVKILGMSPGITTYTNGGTHMCFQDLAIMRAMPNMIVLSPADGIELRACMKWMAETFGPVYIQALRLKVELLHDEGENYIFEPAKAVHLTEGSDVTLVSTGYMTSFALDAAEKLKDKGIGVDLLHCPCVKPFPEEDLVYSAKKTGCVVSVENQNIIGGLGGAVAETLSEQCPVRLKRLGIPDLFGEVVHNDQYIFDKHKFGPQHIVETCQEIIKRS